jgi:hypothetical protein
LETLLNHFILKKIIWENIFWGENLTSKKKRLYPTPTLILHIIKMVKFIPQKFPLPRFHLSFFNLFVKDVNDLLGKSLLNFPQKKKEEKEEEEEKKEEEEEVV